MNFNNKMAKRIAAIVIIVLIAAMVLASVIPYLVTA